MSAKYPLPDVMKPAAKNYLESYLPIRSKDNDFDWGLATGLVLSLALGKRMGDFSINDFKADVRAKLDQDLENRAFFEVIERMYFTDHAFNQMDLYKISPLFLLFKIQGNEFKRRTTRHHRLGNLFANLLGDYRFEEAVKGDLHYFEAVLYESLETRLIPYKDESFRSEQSYLPYLAEAFQKDMAFLGSHPQYLLQELTRTLQLYAFAYSAQLAMNLERWTQGVPSPQPLYFILDTERASGERTKIQHYGYKLFATKARLLFPVLSALEILQHDGQKRPMWQVYQDVCAYPEPQNVLNQLGSYVLEFAEDRKQDPPPLPSSIKEAFEALVSTATNQFKDPKSGPGEINKDYCRELESQLGANFIQSRGRAGRVLVLAQDQVLLLTNLVIGKVEKLRLHELLAGFRLRGFDLDGQSQQALVQFYERMGIVERRSDSGDAIYVRKTV